MAIDINLAATTSTAPPSKVTFRWSIHNTDQALALTLLENPQSSDQREIEVPRGATSIEVADLPPGTEKTYRLRGSLYEVEGFFRYSGVSVESDAVNVRTPGPPLIVPSQFSASYTPGSGVSLSAGPMPHSTDGTGHTGIVFEHSAIYEEPRIIIGPTAIDNPQPGERQYRVAYTNEFGVGVWSQPIVVEIPQPE